MVIGQSSHSRKCLFMIIFLQDDKSGNVSQEDFLLAMEIIFRLYDQDGNNIVTNKEIAKITKLLKERTDSRAESKMLWGISKMSIWISKQTVPLFAKKIRL